MIYINLYLKFNNKKIRKIINTDYYFEQDEEKLKYNLDKLFNNFIIAAEEEKRNNDK